MCREEAQRVSAETERKNGGGLFTGIVQTQHSRRHFDSGGNADAAIITEGTEKGFWCIAGALWGRH